MEPTIITIGRQRGSCGHEIGEKLAEKMGVTFYDKVKLSEIAKGKSYDEVQAFYEEQPVNSLLFAIAVRNSEQGMGKAAFERIRSLCQGQSCVIIGRCANYIFRDNPQAVSIFLHAPMEKRIERVMKLENLLERKATKLIENTDSDRKAFYSYYTKEEWAEAENYELCLDTDKLGIDGTVDTILAYLEERKKYI